MNIRELIKNNAPFSVGTNKTYKINYDNQDLIIKVRNVNEDSLSPFWFQQKTLYGLTYETYVKSIDALSTFLNTNEAFPSSKFIEYGAYPERYQVLKYVKGESWDSDSFPDNKEVAYQMGKYVGYNHLYEYKGFGTINSNDNQNFKEKFFDTMRIEVKKYIKGNTVLLNYIDKLEKKYVPETSYSLIMTDMCADQFIYRDDFKEILGIADVEAYVIGPRSFELTVLKKCFSEENFNFFIKGYTEFRPFEPIKNEEIYWFFVSLNDFAFMDEEAIEKKLL